MAAKKAKDVFAQKLRRKLEYFASDQYKEKDQFLYPPKALESLPIKA